MISGVDKNWTLFLDRDGVINHRPANDYVKSIAEFQFLPGVAEAIRLLSRHFGRIIVVTNQQGVGLGLMSRQTLEEIHQWMVEELVSAGGKIDLILACPDRKDLPENCRKPSIAMANQALEAFPDIVIEKSVMAGDTESDIAFGFNAGMKTVLIGMEKTDTQPDMQFTSLYQFAKFCDNQ